MHDISCQNFVMLVVSTPLTNMKVNWDDYSQLNGTIKFMFQSPPTSESHWNMNHLTFCAQFPSFGPISAFIATWNSAGHQAVPTSQRCCRVSAMTWTLTVVDVWCMWIFKMANVLDAFASFASFASFAYIKCISRSLLGALSFVDLAISPKTWAKYFGSLLQSLWIPHETHGIESKNLAAVEVTRSFFFFAAREGGLCGENFAAELTDVTDDLNTFSIQILICSS